MTIEDRLSRALHAMRDNQTASPEAWMAIQDRLAHSRRRRIAARVGVVVAPLVALGGIGFGTAEVLTPASSSVHVNVGPGPDSAGTTAAPAAATSSTSVATTPSTTVAPTTTVQPTSTAPASVPPSTAAPTTAAPTTAAPTTAAPTTVPPTTVPPPTVPPPTSPPTSPAGQITGTVVDSSGQPVANAYVIGLDTLTVVRTDGSGQFTMSCQVTANGVTGTRTEPLVAAPWLIPVEPATNSGGISYGTGTTKYGAPPTATGPGYAFSGGAADATSAQVVTCGSPPLRFVLPPGGGVDISFVTSSGAPVTTDPEGIPIDNLYLPGLDNNAALETAPLTGGHQIAQQLGAGTLYIDGTSSTLSCTGPGVTADAGRAGADVTVTPGTTTKVVCTVPSASQSASPPPAVSPSPTVSPAVTPTP